MSQIRLELNSDSADKFNSYINSFRSKDLFLDKFLYFQINKLKREVARIQIDLDELEKKYNMTTAEFYTQFENSKLEDSKDFILWAGLCELQQESKNKLYQLL
ncbi:MAG: hypothetical protein L3J41_15760 [Melioribacteraceae bacterium]|nr:hypothetical protein [Melioribacteraceae bacterium]